MTQHEETGTAADQAVPPPGQPAPNPDQPVHPSPYLDTGGSVPQAYLAPPQPGQPKYGTPSGLGPGRPQFGPPQLAGRQARYTQPGYGRAGGARGAFGPAARRDPAIAAPWERLVASLLDWIIIFAVATLAFISPLMQIWQQLETAATRYADPNSPEAQAAIDGILRNPSNERALLFWFLAMFGIALTYYWVQHAAWGATIGKRALGTRVVTATDRSAIGVRAAGIRAVAFLVGPAACLLLPGPFNIPGGLLWLADTGLPLLDPQAQCLHDKIARTIVIRQRWLDQQARSASPW
ncbi:MAG TPA: RDD family protein [Streptosporangiaceae bacterium]|nr:RDD family protein [Streptosporangiaceae bacterium]